MSEPEAPSILLAEDNPADVMLVEQALKEHAIKCKLVVLRDGAEALQFFRHLDDDSTSHAPNLILLDLHLPKYGGNEIIRRVRASQRCAETPVIVMSSSDSPQDRADAERHSASYFRKPVGLDEFMKLGTIILQALADERRETSS